MDYEKLESDVQYLLNNIDSSDSQEIEELKLLLLLFIAKQLSQPSTASRKAPVSDEEGIMTLTGRVKWDSEVKTSSKGRFITFKIDCVETGDVVSCVVWCDKPEYRYSRGEFVTLKGRWSENRGYRNFAIEIPRTPKETAIKTESDEQQEEYEDDVPF